MRIGSVHASDDWVAHASRVPVAVSRRNNLFLCLHHGIWRHFKKSSRSRGRARQHSRRVRYPDNRYNA